MQIDDKATVLVTGATGFVGRALVHRLGTLGCHIKVLAREGSDASTLATNYGAEVYWGDVRSTRTLNDACSDVTHVFHLAARGQSNNSAQGRAETRAVNVDGTKRLAACAARAGSVQQFVYFSTCAVHGSTGQHQGNEASPYGAKSTYELTKLEAELWLRRYASTQSLPLTVLRPVAIVGPGDTRLLKLFRLANQRVIPIIGRGTHRYQIIHIDDCINLLLAAAEAPEATGKVYLCGNPDTLTLKEIIEVLAPARSRVISLPQGLCKALLKGLERAYRLFGQVSPLPESRVQFFTDNHWFDTGWVQQELGVPYAYDNHRALLSTREWYKTQDLL